MTQAVKNVIFFFDIGNVVLEYNQSIFYAVYLAFQIWKL